MATHKKTFTAADLNGNYQLVYVHGLSTEDFTNPTWKDENGICRLASDLFQVVDADTIILNCNGAIEGTQTLYFNYLEAGISSAGRKLFERDLETDPDLDHRLVIGAPMRNITLSALLTWLMSKLEFLKVRNNLSDLTNKEEARSNLSVYSNTEVNTAMNGKASLYQAASGGALGTNNTKKYNPLSSYNPATLRNVKNLGRRVLLAGSVTSAGVLQDPLDFKNTDILTDIITSSRIGTGHYRITHNIGNTNYRVIASAVGDEGNAVGFKKVNKQATFFDVTFGDDSSLNDTDFDFTMFDFLSYTND